MIGGGVATVVEEGARAGLILITKQRVLSLGVIDDIVARAHPSSIGCCGIFCGFGRLGLLLRVFRLVHRRNALHPALLPGLELTCHHRLQFCFKLKFCLETSHISYKLLISKN